MARKLRLDIIIKKPKRFKNQMPKSAVLGLNTIFQTKSLNLDYKLIAFQYFDFMLSAQWLSYVTEPHLKYQNYEVQNN